MRGKRREKGRRGEERGGGGSNLYESISIVEPLALGGQEGHHVAAVGALLHLFLVQLQVGEGHSKQNLASLKMNNNNNNTKKKK